MSAAPNAGTAVSFADLKTCEQEPIHIPASVQPHGALLTLGGANLTVAQASANAGELLGVPQAEIVGTSLASCFGDAPAQVIADDLRATSLDEYPSYLRTLRASRNGRKFCAIGHRYSGVLILELEPCESRKEISFRDLLSLFRTSMYRLKRASDLSSLAQLAAEEIKQITQYGRVLVCRFDSQWNGHVYRGSA